jgi:hypothetical protein
MWPEIISHVTVVFLNGGREKGNFGGCREAVITALDTVRRPLHHSPSLLQRFTGRIWMTWESRTVQRDPFGLNAQCLNVIWLVVTLESQLSLVGAARAAVLGSDSCPFCSL